MITSRNLDAFCAAIVLAALYGKLRISVLRDVGQTTLKITTMVFVILIGASVFSLVFRAYRGEAMVEEVLTQLPGGMWSAVIVVMAIIFLLGFFIDAFEIMFIVLPIAGPGMPGSLAALKLREP